MSKTYTIEEFVRSCAGGAWWNKLEGASQVNHIAVIHDLPKCREVLAMGREARQGSESLIVGASEERVKQVAAKLATQLLEAI